MLFFFVYNCKGLAERCFIAVSQQKARLKTLLTILFKCRKLVQLRPRLTGSRLKNCKKNRIVESYLTSIFFRNYIFCVLHIETD